MFALLNFLLTSHLFKDSFPFPSSLELRMGIGNVSSRNPTNNLQISSLNRQQPVVLSLFCIQLSPIWYSLDLTSITGHCCLYRLAKVH